MKRSLEALRVIICDCSKIIEFITESLIFRSFLFSFVATSAVQSLGNFIDLNFGTSLIRLVEPNIVNKYG